MNLQSAVEIGTYTFGVLGSIGLVIQARTIWSHRSVASLSVIWILTYVAMFASFLLYGIRLASTPMMFQGWIRIAFYIPIVVGYLAFAKVDRQTILLFLLYSSLLFGMSRDEYAAGVYILLSYLGIWSSFVQGYTIYRLKRRGTVSVSLQSVYLVATFFWLTYGALRQDIPIMITSIGFTLSYLLTIIMWITYPEPVPVHT